MTFLQSMKIAVPARIDRSLMRSMSGAMQSSMISSLEYLQLITPETGVPTDRLTQLVRSEGAERQKVLKDIITTTYPFLFKGDIDLTRATSHQVQEAFAKLGMSGDTTRKTIAFFMFIAKEAGLTLSPHLKAPRNRSAGAPKGKLKPTRNESKTTQDAGKETQIVPPTETMAWEQLLLSKFPSFDPAWPDDVKSKWFQGFNDLMANFR